MFSEFSRHTDFIMGVPSHRSWTVQKRKYNIQGGVKVGFVALAPPHGALFPNNTGKHNRDYLLSDDNMSQFFMQLDWNICYDIALETPNQGSSNAMTQSVIQ